MKPIDNFSYLRHNKVFLDSASLTQLYFPIVGGDAVALYQYLVHFFDDGAKEHKFSEILNHLQFGMRRLEEAFVMLTAVDLLVLYQTREKYLLKLQPALGNEAFLNNPIYRRLLEQRIGDVAVEEMLLKIPDGARDISKKFSDVFTDIDQPMLQQKDNQIHFDLDSFQRLMQRDGLRFKDEKKDVIELYNIAERFSLNWFDTYTLAKETAINAVISPKRMQARRKQARSEQSSDQFSQKEQIIVREAKQTSAKDFLMKIKKSRHAVVTKSEEKLLEDLANMSFLDEVISVMLLYTLDKTKSANVNKPYIMKLANDFAYQQVASAEEAVLKLRSFAERKNGQKKKSAKSNIPEWTEKEYKQVATAEETAKLEELKRSMLED